MKIIGENIDTSIPYCRFTINLLSNLYEMDLELIRHLNKEKLNLMRIINLRPSVIFIPILLLLFSCNSIDQSNRIYGIWEGSYMGKKYTFSFKINNICTVDVFDKKNQLIETVSGEFSLDFSKKPILLSIKKIPQLDHPLYSIIEFVGQNSLNIAAFSPKWRLRPIAFDKEKTIFLTYRSK